MSWKEIKSLYNSLLEDIDSPKFKKKWEDFRKVVKNSERKKIQVTKFILESLNKINKKKDDIYILDHGCGNGLKSVYLLALGYKNIYGVNVHDEVEQLNKIILKTSDIEERRFFKTDGSKIPFSKEKFDLIISCQVVEHVNDKLIDFYYKEEGRVLKKGGYAYHEVPHLLVPYDSHSRLWLAHWAPNFIKPFAYGVLKSIQQRKNLLKNGKDYAKKFNGKFLFLRLPGFHKKKLVKYIGYNIYEPNLKDRIINKYNMIDFDNDAPKLIRRFINIVLNLPLVGSFIGIFIKKFLMLHTLTKK